MNVPNIKSRLEPKTLELISKSTKLSKEELCILTIKEARDKMFERGAIKKPNPIKTFLKNLYKKLGEKFGLLDKHYNIYTDVD